MAKPGLARLQPPIVVLMVLVLGAKVHSVISQFPDASILHLADPLLARAYAAADTKADAATPSATQPTPAVSDKPAEDAALAAANRCNHDIACTEKPKTDNSVPSPEFFSDIARRQQELDAERAELDSRKRAVDTAQAAIEQRMASLSADEANVRNVEQHDRILSDNDAAKLTKIYQEMKPVDAAAIFNILDLRVSAQLLSQMDAKHASAIMSAMSPQRAILATQVLAREHLPVAAAVDHSG